MTLPLIIGSFYLGQFIASYGYTPIEAVEVLLLCTSMAAGFWIFRSTRMRCISSFTVLGILSVFLRCEFVGWYEAPPGARFMVEVISIPQRPKPNIVRFSVDVKKVLFRVNGAMQMAEDPLLNKSLVCSAPELPWRNISGVKAGDLFLAELRILSLSGDRSPVSYEGTLRRRGIAAKCIMKNVVRISPPNEPTWYESLMRWLSNYEPYQMEGGLFASLIFGFRTSLSQVLERHFQYAGLSHLLVFSGAQVTIIFVALGWALHLIFCMVSYCLRFYKGASWSKPVALALTFFFVLSIGSDKTTVRALIAAVVSFAAVFFHRKSSVAWGILISSFILSILWPGSFLEPGLQLTYAALFGIWLGILRRSFIWGFLYTSFATSCISLFWFEAFSLMGFLVNPVVVPVVSIVTTVGGLPALALALLDFNVGKILLEWNFIFLMWLEEGVYQISMLSWSYFQVPQVWARILGFSGLLLLCLEVQRIKKLLCRVQRE